MLPTWLPAVREAWTSGESVDFEEVSLVLMLRDLLRRLTRISFHLQIESEHRAKPLAGVVFTMTHFAQGEFSILFCS